MPTEPPAHEQLAALLLAAERPVALTGLALGAIAPTEEGAGGDEWSRRASLEHLLTEPADFWAFYHPQAEAIAARTPGPGHEALARLERAGVLAALVMTYTAASRLDGRRKLAAGLVVAAAFVTAFAVDREELNPSNVVGNAAVFAGGWAMGAYVRSRQREAAALRDRTARLERERELLAREAVAEERARIARELHDVVAHSVSVMTVQAGAARRVMATDPGGAAQALGAVEATGREALVELRRLLGVLRQDDQATDALRPQPSVADLPRLIRDAEGAGLRVERVVEGHVRPLPPGVDLSAFRIVQEALTNARKHGGPAAAARVVVRYGDEDLEVEVTDDGRGASAPPGDGGHGLVGMRERVGLFGGELAVGPADGGGWRVWARLPIGADTP